jgi:hypothetical protein
MTKKSPLIILGPHLRHNTKIVEVCHICQYSGNQNAQIDVRSMCAVKDKQSLCNVEGDSKSVSDSSDLTVPCFPSSKHSLAFSRRIYVQNVLHSLYDLLRVCPNLLKFVCHAESRRVYRHAVDQVSFVGASTTL